MELLTLDQIKNLTGDFAWDFGCYFFIETEVGNFIWSDPEYNGDGSIRPTDKTYIEYIRSSKIPFMRDKGTHKIGEYCKTIIRVGDMVL